jgi:hypothetical protein
MEGMNSTMIRTLVNNTIYPQQNNKKKSKRKKLCESENKMTTFLEFLLLTL